MMTMMMMQIIPVTPSPFFTHSVDAILRMKPENTQFKSVKKYNSYSYMYTASGLVPMWAHVMLKSLFTP